MFPHAFSRVISTNIGLLANSENLARNTTRPTTLCQYIFPKRFLIPKDLFRIEVCLLFTRTSRFSMSDHGVLILCMIFYVDA